MNPVDENDSVAQDWPLFGLYRVQEEAPGFAIPLFRGADGRAYAQLSDGTEHVSGFVGANISGCIVFAPPEASNSCSARVGDRLLYAFHKPDGSFHIGARDSVEKVVREELHKLRTLPFTWREAACFVSDQEQIRLASIETDKLLRWPDESAELDRGVGGIT